MKYKYWPYAFRQILFIDRYITPINKETNAIDAITGSKPLGKRLRTWGCRVWIRKHGKRSHKLHDHSLRGRFLGFAGTTKNIIYMDESNHNIKTAKSVVFGAENTVP